MGLLLGMVWLYAQSGTLLFYDGSDTDVEALRDFTGAVITSYSIHYTKLYDAHRIASNRYEGGLARYLDVLTAEDALLNNERALVNLESRAFSLDLALVYALGGGYTTNP